MFVGLMVKVKKKLSIVSKNSILETITITGIINMMLLYFMKDSRWLVIT